MTGKPTFTLNAYNGAPGSSTIVAPANFVLIGAIISGVDLSQLSNSPTLEGTTGQQSSQVICQQASSSATQPISTYFPLNIPLKSGQKLYFNSGNSGAITLLLNQGS